MTPPNTDQILSLGRTSLKGAGIWLILEGLHSQDRITLAVLVVTGAALLALGCWFSWKTHSDPDA